MGNRIVFCDDDTCKHNNGGFCDKDKIHITVTTVGYKDGKDVFYNYCEDYEDNRRGKKND